MRRFVFLACLTAAAWAGTVTYTYDDAGRLAKVDYGDGRSIAYTYDNSGNLLRREVTAPQPASDPGPAAAAKQPNATGGAGRRAVKKRAVRGGSGKQ